MSIRKSLGRAITEAMRKSKDGRLQINLPEIEQWLDQAYYIGREDGQK